MYIENYRLSIDMTFFIDILFLYIEQAYTFPFVVKNCI